MITMEIPPTAAESSNYDAGIAAYKRGHYEMAMYDFEQRAEQGDPVAQFCLAFMYKYGIGVEPDIQKAIEWYTKSAEQGYASAQNDLGVMYELIAESELYSRSENSITYLAEAQKWIFDAAKQEDPTAQFNASLLCRLAASLSSVVGLPTDFTETVDINRLVVNWIQIASDNNYPPAKYELAVIYREGFAEVAIDPEKSFQLLIQAATPNPDAAPPYKHGYAQAQHDLATMYARGDGVEKDFKEALKWFQMAAKQGIAESQFSLGLAYFKGNGVNQNYKEAAKWYRMAADQGFARAQNILAEMYNDGNGVSINPEMAWRLTMASAQQGYAVAQADLAMNFAEGQQMVSRDDEEAYFWYGLAFKEDIALDKTDFGINVSKYDVSSSQVSDRLSEEQKSIIQKQVDNWKPKQLVSYGTGFYISKNLILTNAHVVSSANELRVPFHRVEVIAVDEELDMALLFNKHENNGSAIFRSYPVDFGEEVVVFGYPLSSILSYRGNITLGSVSGLSSTIDDAHPDKLFQHTAPTQKGNCGGPVFDAAGNVVGVVLDPLTPSLVSNKGKIEIVDVQNVNFAVKFDVIEDFFQKNNITDYRDPIGVLAKDIDLKQIYNRAEKFTVPVLCFVNKPERESLQLEEIGIDGLEWN